MEHYYKRLQRYNAFAFFCALSLFFYSIFPLWLRDVLIIINIIVPWLSLFLAIKFNNVIAFGTLDKANYHKDLSASWFLSSLFMVFPFFNVKVGDLNTISLYISFFSLAFFIIIFKFINTKKAIWVRIAVAIFGAALGISYGYGVVSYTNIRFDKNEVKFLESKVLSKDAIRGRSGGYQIIIRSDSIQNSLTFKVHEKQFEDIVVGQDVIIESHSGFLDIPWYNLKYDEVK